MSAASSRGTILRPNSAFLEIKDNVYRCSLGTRGCGLSLRPCRSEEARAPEGLDLSTDRVTNRGASSPLGRGDLLLPFPWGQSSGPTGLPVGMCQTARSTSGFHE